MTRAKVSSVRSLFQRGQLNSSKLSYIRKRDEGSWLEFIQRPTTTFSLLGRTMTKKMGAGRKGGRQISAFAHTQDTEQESHFGLLWEWMEVQRRQIEDQSGLTPGTWIGSTTDGQGRALISHLAISSLEAKLIKVGD
jgi:hypothetical protein